MRVQFGFGAVRLSAALASAQTLNWTRTSSALNVNQPHPAVRDGGGMAYDPIHQQSILFGGLGGGTEGPTIRSDTWAYTGGGTWAQLSPSTVPGGRFGNSMVFDSNHGNIVIYTSYDFDSTRGMIVMFGGGEGKTVGDIYLQDTWEYK